MAVSVSVTVHDGVRDGRRLRLGFRLGVARLGPKRTRRRVVAEGIIVAPRVGAVCRPVEKTVRVRGGVIFVVVVDRDVVLVNLVRLWGGRRAADGARRLLRRAPPGTKKAAPSAFDAVLVGTGEMCLVPRDGSGGVRSVGGGGGSGTSVKVRGTIGGVGGGGGGASSGANSDAADGSSSTRDSSSSASSSPPPPPNDASIASSAWTVGGSAAATGRGRFRRRRRVRFARLHGR